MNAFEGCSSLATIALPAGVTEIGMSVFKDCSSLATLALPAGVTKIGTFALQGCSSLTALTLPAGLTTIDQEAFSGCSSLTALALPTSLAVIEEDAFDGCSSFTTLTIVSDHAEPKVLTREQPFDTEAVLRALAPLRAAYPIDAAGHAIVPDGALPTRPAPLEPPVHPQPTPPPDTSASLHAVQAPLHPSPRASTPPCPPHRHHCPSV